MNLFTATQVEYDEVINCVNVAVSDEQNMELSKEVTKDEVKAALF